MKNRDEIAPEMDEALQTRLGHALSRQPAVTVPAGFAARVVSTLPQRGQVPARPRSSVARPVAIVAALVLAVAMFVLAPHVATARSLAFALEMLLLTQLAGVGYGLVRMSDQGL